jgi:hypothetical protein
MEKTMKRIYVIKPVMKYAVSIFEASGNSVGSSSLGVFDTLDGARTVAACAAERTGAEVEDRSDISESTQLYNALSRLISDFESVMACHDIPAFRKEQAEQFIRAAKADLGKA